MPTIILTRKIQGEMQPQITFVLNGAVLPHVGEKIKIEGVYYVVRQVCYETAVDITTGNYYICSVQMLADDEKPKEGK